MRYIRDDMKLNKNVKIEFKPRSTIEEMMDWIDSIWFDRVDRASKPRVEDNFNLLNKDDKTNIQGN